MEAVEADLASLDGVDRLYNSAKRLDRPRRRRFVPDSSLEGTGFELPVPQCALSSPTARPWSRPPDLAVSGGALNGHLTTPIGGRPATPRLTRREDRSAQLGRGPEDLVIGRQRTIGFLTGSASSVVRAARAELRSLGPPSRPSAAPTGIDWTRLSAEDLDEMPILAELKRMTTSNA